MVLRPLTPGPSTAAKFGAAIESALARPGSDLGSPSVTAIAASKPVDRTAAIAELTSEVEALEALLSSMDLEQWGIECTVDGGPSTIGWCARHVVHDGVHRLALVGRLYAIPLGSGVIAVGDVVGVEPDRNR